MKNLLLGSVAGESAQELLRTIKSLSSKDHSDRNQHIANLAENLGRIKPELAEFSIKKLIAYITMYSSLGAVCIVIDILCIDDVLGG